VRPLLGKVGLVFFPPSQSHVWFPFSQPQTPTPLLPPYDPPSLQSMLRHPVCFLFVPPPKLAPPLRFFSRFLGGPVPFPLGFPQLLGFLRSPCCALPRKREVASLTRLPLGRTPFLVDSQSTHVPLPPLRPLFHGFS